MASIYDLICSATTEGDAWAVSLPNVRGEGREQQLTGRDPDKLTTWSKKRDEAGFAQFFCVSTIEPRQRRKKEYAVQLCWLFADIDFKDVDLDPEEIKARLLGLELVPSRIHATGNGFHVFWRLERPLQLQERDNLSKAEALLKRLANHIGGDLQVAHVVALLRVPGTHNSKRGEWRRVTVLREGRETYTLDQIERWVGFAREPVMVRRDRQSNPWLRVAEEQSFKAPVDVEQRLRDMEFGGEGPKGVHATHLSVTASLTAADWDEDDVVNLVLPVTMALEGTENWNWVLEERTLRTMIQDFDRKLQRQRRSRATLSAAAVPPDDDDPDDAVSLGDASNVIPITSAKGKATKAPPKKPAEHITLGKGFLEELKDEGMQLMYAEKQAWWYEAGIWRALDDAEEKKEINERVERGCRECGIVSTTKIVNETRAWLQRNPDLSKKKVAWDNHGRIATRSGLVSWTDGSVEPLAPWHYATRLIDCVYDPEATCPIWEDILYDDYMLDDGTIDFLQEFFGTILITDKPRGLMRALVLLGQSNTGKSNILKVFSGLISETCNSTDLQALEGAHGLMQFLKPNPWVLHEAFEQSRWEMSAKAKALLSGDPVQVNIKNGALLTLVFKQAIMWGTNVPPQFKESSRAMEMRLAIVKMHRAFNPMHVTGTALRAIEEGYRTPAELVLASEKSGLLNWAIVGLKRALARKHFKFTQEMQESLNTMRIDGNIVLGFIEECTDYDRDIYVTTADFNAAFNIWWRDHRGAQAVPTPDAVGRAMNNLSNSRILTGQHIGKARVYAGLRINEPGLNCWNAYSMELDLLRRRSGQPISQDADRVNKKIGPQQLEKQKFRDMQEAHRTWSPEPEEPSA